MYKAKKNFERTLLTVLYIVLFGYRIPVGDIIQGATWAINMTRYNGTSKMVPRKYNIETVFEALDWDDDGEEHFRLSWKIMRT